MRLDIEKAEQCKQKDLSWKRKINKSKPLLLAFAAATVPYGPIGAAGVYCATKAYKEREKRKVKKI